MLRDARYAIRLLLRRPVFAVSAILTLAFCIGANTAIYTVVDRLLLRPLLLLLYDRLILGRGDVLARGLVVLEHFYELRRGLGHCNSFFSVV